MVDKINGTKGVNSSGATDKSENSFSKNVEAKKAEIQKDSIFNKHKGENKEYLAETAFLLTTFDKDNDGNITQDEIDSVDESDYNKQFDQYNNDGELLVLDNFDGVKAKLEREITPPETKNNKNPKKAESGLLASLHVAAQSQIDKSNENSYTGVIKDLVALSDKQNLSKDEKTLLEYCTKQQKYLEKILSPESIKRALMQAGTEIQADDEEKNGKKKFIIEKKTSIDIKLLNKDNEIK